RAMAGVNACEAVQQGSGDGVGLDQAEQSCVESAGQALDRLGSKALVEGLRGEGAAEVGGHVGEFVEGSVGVRKPAEGESLHEGRPGEAAATADEAGRGCGIVRFGGENGL